MFINNKCLLSDCRYVPAKIMSNFKDAVKSRKIIPEIIVIHYTAGADKESSLRELIQYHEVCAHILIGKDGEIIQMVPFNVRANHAGQSIYNGKKNVNYFSIGIELDNWGKLTPFTTPNGTLILNTWTGSKFEGAHYQHKDESGNITYWEKFTTEQLKSCFLLCNKLRDIYKIKNIVGHEDVSPGRKIDPGKAFPMIKLRKYIFEGEIPDLIKYEKEDEKEVEVSVEPDIKPKEKEKPIKQEPPHYVPEVTEEENNSIIEEQNTNKLFKIIMTVINFIIKLIRKNK